MKICVNLVGTTGRKTPGYLTDERRECEEGFFVFVAEINEAATSNDREVRMAQMRVEVVDTDEKPIARSLRGWGDMVL